MTPVEAADDTGTGRVSRLDRARRPRAVDVLRETAAEVGVCLRPVLIRRIDTGTGETEIIEIDCGATRAAVCPPCAEKARRLRAHQCREGWHLTDEPDLTPDPASDEQRNLMIHRATATEDDDDAATADADEQLAASGVRGGLDQGRRHIRSTRRRDDVPDLPRRPATTSTLGRVFTDPATGATFRPSLFVTLTLPSYGRVDADGTPLRPETYDYTRAARDALHFGKLLDRFTQNLRRVAGYDAQYFAAVEPQKRAAPHVHYAIRGTLPRATVRAVAAATYVNIWWPTTDRVVYDGTHLPTWTPVDPDDDQADHQGDDQSEQGARGQMRGSYVDPDTGHALPTWAEAIDALDDETDNPTGPAHTVRFGDQVDVKGLLAGSPDAERAIGYLVKYLVKDLGDDLDPTTDPGNRDGESRRPISTRRRDHVARLVEALRHEPCSPTCPNWLRYGIQPKNPRPGMRPGSCAAKAHRPSHLGYGGRRVLVSRKWTGKDLPDHRHDRKAHVLAALAAAGHLSATDSQPSERVRWEYAQPTDPDIPPAQQRLLRRIAHAVRQRDEYRRARDGTGTVAAHHESHTDTTDSGRQAA